MEVKVLEEAMHSAEHLQNNACSIPKSSGDITLIESCLGTAIS